MTLPASIPVGFHATVPEISAMQDAVNAILTDAAGQLTLADLIVSNNLNVGVTLQVDGPTQLADVQIDGTLDAEGLLLSADFQSSNGIRVGTPAAATQSGRIYQGSGVPSNTNGANGDAYFRTDTPGTANQRLYVKAAGAWVGIL